MLPYWLLFMVFAFGAIVTSRPNRLVAPRRAASDTANRKSIQEKRRPGLSAVAFAAALMIGFRFSVGADWDAYERIYDQISGSDFVYALARTDPGYGALNWLAAQLGAGIWAVNLICGLLFIFGLRRFAMSQPLPWLVFVVAVPYLVIGVGMGYSRQAVAIGFVMGGMAALARGSFFRFAVWILFASVFHSTALIMLVLMGMSYSRNRFETFVLTVVFSLVAYFLIDIDVERFQRSYVDRVYAAEGAGVRLAMNAVPALIFLSFSRRFYVSEIEWKMWRNLAILSLIFFGLWAGMESTVAIDRMALYAIPLQLFVLARLPIAFGKNAELDIQLLLLTIIYSALVQVVWLNFANHAEYWLPYRIYPLSFGF